MCNTRKAKALCAVVALCLALTACSEKTASPNASTLLTAKHEKRIVETVNESTVQDAPLQETTPAQEESTMKNIALGKVPDGYYTAAAQQGKLVNFTYDTRDYIGNGNMIQSSATVYLNKNFKAALEGALLCLIDRERFKRFLG